MSYSTTVSNNSISISLSRTGGQGSKGDSVTDVTMDVNGDLIVEYTTSAGVVTTENIGGSEYYAQIIAARDAAVNAGDAFTSAFLGTYATAPTTAIDGGPLTAGMMYYNSTDEILYFYNATSAIWSTPEADAQADADRAELAATNAATSETNAATSEASASTYATTAQTASTNASNAATAAATSETNAANSATAAASSAASVATSETNAANSATTALGHANTASTAATNANTSATAAGASATSAANSATAAATSETNAGTSETNAATSATQAATSASTALTASTNAASSASAAIAAYDNFDDRYLGVKATDPTLDNDGDALQTGALYFNSGSNVMRVYNGSVWVTAYVSAIALNDITDVSATSPNTGEVLKWNGTAWAAAADNEGTTISSLNDVADVTITSATSGEFLKWNGSAWVNDSIPSINVLNDVGNVTITTIASGEILKWDGTAWVNNTLAEAGIQPAGSYEPADATILKDADIGVTVQAAGSYAAASHTHLKADITDFSDADYATAAQGTLADNAIPSSEKGAANGVATLDGSGLVPASQLPSYVDDVLEYANEASFPATGETGKLYVDLSDNSVHRWTGTVYVNVTDFASPTHTHTASEITDFDTEVSNNTDVAANTSKLAGIEAGADVTDTVNVEAAGALMDSEVTNLAQVKAFNSADYATAAQGALADSALQNINSLSIEELSDVNTMTPTDGQVLTWDNANSRWDAADASGGLETQTATEASTAQVTIATFAFATFNGVKAFISVVEGTTRQVSEMLITHDGTTPYATEYGTVFTGSAELATFDVDIVASDIRIRATGADATSKDYTVTFTAI